MRQLFEVEADLAALDIRNEQIKNNVLTKRTELEKEKADIIRHQMGTVSVFLYDLESMILDAITRADAEYQQKHYTLGAWPSRYISPHELSKHLKSIIMEGRKK